MNRGKLASKFWYVAKGTFYFLNLKLILDATTAYPKSKTLAEKTIWNFIDSFPKDSQFDAVTINPGFILGPILSNPLH